MVRPGRDYPSRGRGGPAGHWFVPKSRLVASVCCWTYLQGEESLVCPGGWQRAPGSCGPLSLLPGPKLPATAGAAEIDSAEVARMPASILRLIGAPFFGEFAQPQGHEVVRLRSGLELSDQAAFCAFSARITSQIATFGRADTRNKPRLEPLGTTAALPALTTNRVNRRRLFIKRSSNGGAVAAGHAAP